ILDQGWSEFKRQLKYKLEWLRGVYVEVNPSYTSQKCSSCANIDKKSRIIQSKFCCISCEYTENADINAAKNILAAGHVVLACGEDALATSMKQEPLNMGDLSFGLSNQESSSFREERMSMRLSQRMVFYSITGTSAP
ncbi:MAG: transposase, partial [Candidatus Neptunochlamydia sp.]|nr:transposase [Candidatus Neptunochlamydia sp.]